ncbi:MAG TPA: hypothetical protein ENK61_00405 [Devosia sp.]|nr:hypothetical protein [Devosia sp.]
MLSGNLRNGRAGTGHFPKWNMGYPEETEGRECALFWLVQISGESPFDGAKMTLFYFSQQPASGSKILAMDLLTKTSGKSRALKCWHTRLQELFRVELAILYFCSVKQDWKQT